MLAHMALRAVEGTPISCAPVTAFLFPSAVCVLDLPPSLVPVQFYALHGRAVAAAVASTTQPTAAEPLEAD